MVKEVLMSCWFQIKILLLYLLWQIGYTCQQATVVAEKLSSRVTSFPEVTFIEFKLLPPTPINVPSLTVLLEANKITLSS